MEKKNMNTTAAEVTTTTAPEVAAHDWKESFETITVDEYLNRVDNGDILNPRFQSGIRWTEKQSARLIECLKAGRPVPPLMIVAVPASDGGNILLRVDGNQRTAAIMAAIEAADDEEREAILACHITLQTVCAPSLEECGRLFLDLNNGAPLSGIQKQKVELPEAVQAIVDEAQSAFAAEVKRGGKYGKVNADTGATFVLAAILSPANASTSSASAMKALKAVTVNDEKRKAALAVCARVLSAVRVLAAADAKAEATAKAAEAAAIEKGTEAESVRYGNKGGAEALYWRSPAHLVPVAVYAAVHRDETPEELAAKMAEFNPAQKSAFVYKRPAGKGEKRERTTIAAAFSDKSNARAATRARIMAFAAFAASFSPEEDEAEAAALAETVATLSEVTK